MKPHVGTQKIACYLLAALVQVPAHMLRKERGGTSLRRTAGGGCPRLDRFYVG